MRRRTSSPAGNEISSIASLGPGPHPPSGTPILRRAVISASSALNDVVLSQRRARLEAAPTQQVDVDRVGATIQDFLRHEQAGGRTVHEAVAAEPCADEKAVRLRQSSQNR